MKPNTFGFNWKATGQWNIDVTFFIEYRKSKAEKIEVKNMQNLCNKVTSSNFARKKLQS